jgi:NAD(P)-dependent dehydrogenase (short-subunit alcohol dehydrogenase family)
VPLILITGVSTGIGKALAERFARDGWAVVGTVREVSRMADAQWPGDVRLEEIDFAERGSGRALGDRVVAAHGTPDVLVNNAGTLQFIPVEDESPESVEELYRVNVFEPVDLIRALAPAMREAGGGTVVNVTSLGGRMTFPFFTTYNSSKHALEGYSEGLWHELQLSKIRVKVVEPGFVETAIWGKSVRSRGESPYQGSGPYGEAMASMARFEGSITNRSTPEQAAEEIRAAILDPSDRLRYPVAAYARPMLRARRWFGELRVMRFFHKRWMGGS